MKLILLSILLCSLAAPIMAADPAPKKKADSAESAKKSKKEKAPSAEAQALSDSLSAAQKTKLLKLLNEGDDKALAALPGVGVVRAVAIKAARPFAAPTDLLKVVGIGDATFKEIIEHAKADFPPPAPKAKGKKGKGKGEAKKGEEEAKK
jgi:hypothetical protein